MMMSLIRHQNVMPDSAMPSLAGLWREVAALANLKRRFPAGNAIRPHSQGVGAPVMVIPGFLASDASTAPLRSGLAASGYDVHGWGQGSNLGANEARLERLARDVADLAQRRDAPVMLVGWSLGGLFAREIAKRTPEHVARVVTLGSPFSGNPRGNRVWRLYEWVNGHPVDALPIACDLSAKPPVPTIALWSRDDGIVATACARGLPHETDSAVEISCSHIGFTFEPAAIAAVIEALRGEQGENWSSH